MKRLLTLLLCLSFMPLLHATHNIAGEITVTCLGGLQYRVSVKTYTNSLSPADRCDLTVDWGDGVQTIAPRVNGPLGTCANNSTMGDTQGPANAGYVNTKENIYEAVHTYMGPSPPGGYIISIKDPNRVAGIDNIPNSVNVPFYLQTTLVVDPFVGCNSTPTLTSMPLDKACVGHCFYHNPGAVDPEGDSLAYSIGPCLDTSGIPIIGYQYPNIAGGGNLSIDPATGDLSWCSPSQPGKYNLVIYIEEWRRFPNGTRMKVSTILRDMSIDVLSSCNNDNPEIDDIPDLCVDAGQTVNFSFTVNDPNSGDLVNLIGYGSSFSNATNPATVVSLNPAPAVPFNATYNWVTTCEEVRLQPWIATFKATDNGSPVALTDIETVRITVVSPGPAFLNTAPQGTNMNLDWGQNPCNPAANYCVGYKIYRRQGPSAWNPLQCETGVPSYTGFVQIGTVVGYTNTTFVDNNGGAGLIPGVDYCYRVCAYFADGAESYASPESCNELRRDIPVITNVDVMSTGSNDPIFVRWENAVPNGFDFDTIAHPGPWVLVLERTPGFTFNGTPTLVSTMNSPIFMQLPTTVTDNGLQTDAGAYTYRLSFYASNGAEFIGYSQPASSVYLSAAGSDNTVTLSWQYNVPWTNYEFAIYRYNPNTTNWDSIALAPGPGTYVDDSLQNGVEYCYYITAHGSYYNASLPPIMYNRSQRTCATPIDLTPPCAPVLTVNSDCQNATNQIIWTNPMNMNCGTDDVVTYQVWYTPVEGEPMYLLTTITLSSDTTVTFTNMNSVAGCYAVTAIDTFNNVSPMSNVVCVDNCPEYELPNVFTPNGDNVNDNFIPFPYQYIESVDVKIYDRWGNLVFQTTDPALIWDGRDMTSKKLCTDGVYYYTCIVNEIRLEGIVPREIKGFVHLFGKDIGQFH